MSSHIPEIRTDEDKIIETLIIEGNDSLYEDLDFLPTRQSLYNVENVVPDYDDEVSEHIEWRRPSVINDNAVYFNPSSKKQGIVQGSLKDSNFLGTLIAVCVYPKYDLMENIFSSRPGDFLKYGIYTCRFYVNEEWVDLITDTNIPCLRNSLTGVLKPVYGQSINPDEMWVSFVEKSFAKAMGSYEEITQLKVQKALLHLTGGSVQQISLYEESVRLDLVNENSAWNEFKKRSESDCLILLVPSEKKHADVHNAEEDVDEASSKAENYFIPEMIYSVILCKDLGGYELVLMHNPWNDPNYVWSGEWSDQSNDWELYPEMLVEVEKDPNVPWTRRRPNGYFWISYRSIVKYFSKMYVCKLFPSDKFNFYCVKGEAKGITAGGPLQCIREGDVVTREAQQSKQAAIVKSTAACIIDGDPSWFCNSQYRLTTHTSSAHSHVRVFISVVPIGSAEEMEGITFSITVARVAKAAHQPKMLWDWSLFEVIATDKSAEISSRSKGVETSIWGVECDPHYYYYIVPSAAVRNLEGAYVLRVYSSAPVVLECVQSPLEYRLKGEWRRVGDLDTGGGGLTITHTDGTVTENSKWCQNPQFHLEVADPYSTEELYLKIVVRRTDKGAHKDRHSHRAAGHAGNAHGHGSAGTPHDNKKDACVGLVVTKADCLIEDPLRAKKKKSRQNRFGEPIPLKESSLKKSREFSDETAGEPSQQHTSKVILRKLNIDPLKYHQETSFQSRAEACVFYPKLPRSWIPDGIILVPCLNEKGVKGAFELDVYASEKIYLSQLPETYSRTVAGEWTDATAGGSHVSPNWKKNPKIDVKFHFSITNEAPVKVRITLAKYGNEWRNMAKKDTVGCMVGFYLFTNRDGELYQVYESPFVPETELSTEPSFAIAPLPHGDFYTIMPTTYSEGKVGPFVVSIMSEVEFSITKEK